MDVGIYSASILITNATVPSINYKYDFTINILDPITLLPIKSNTNSSQSTVSTNNDNSVVKYIHETNNMIGKNITSSILTAKISDISLTGLVTVSFS